MRYFTDKTKEQLLHDIDLNVTNEMNNMTPNIRIDNLEYMIRDCIVAGFKTLLENMTPDTVVDDELLKDDNKQERP